MKLSICIIAKNEEQMLGDCLASVRSIASEIILVDTGSTDKTKAIAQQYGCKIYDFPWINDFAAARNESLKYATGDWILVLDADERVPNAKSVVNTINNTKEHIGGLLCNMVSTARNSLGKTDTNTTMVMRLFRNKPEFHFIGVIHEQILGSILTNGYKIAKTELSIHHIGYDIPVAELNKKNQRNLDLLEDILRSNPTDSVYYKNHKAKTLQALGRDKEAYEYYNSILPDIPDDNQTKIEALNNTAVLARNYANDIDRAIALAQHSLKIEPNQPDANYLLGDFWTAKNNSADALDAYLRMQKAMEHPADNSLLVGTTFIPQEMVHHRIGRALMGIGDYVNSIKEFEKGLAIVPNDASCLVGIANVAFKLKQFSQAKGVLQVALAAHPEHTEIMEFIKQMDSRIDDKPSESMSEQRTGLLSVCMIVKNEEKMLPGCLDSIKDIADEIVIVDTGSSDRTIEIAEEYGAKLHYFKWIDDFSAARNESIKYATGKWILYLDADERVTPSSHTHIRALLQTAGADIGGYYCIIESNHHQLDGSAEMHRGAYPRLFRNYGYPKINFKGRVHEQISPSLIELKALTLQSDITIEHLGYNLSSEEMHVKARRNYNMLIQHVNDEPTNGYAWFQLGQTLGQMELWQEAEDATLFAIKCGSLADSVYASATATLSQFSGRKKNFEEALRWANESLSKVPNQLFGLSLKAHSLLYMCRFAEAEVAFKEALSLFTLKERMPRSGFDIDISEELLNKGLAAARNKDEHYR
ncbi:MAG: glycosyltransferase [Ignavibacteria bacterium]|jgi:glycosyltransferase involved in cell wall biosynthesis|nr:glycosyltransferase [Ignavibacteria bacterium]